MKKNKSLTRNEAAEKKAEIILWAIGIIAITALLAGLFFANEIGVKKVEDFQKRQSNRVSMTTRFLLAKNIIFC